jgi:hypothetical protein
MANCLARVLLESLKRLGRPLIRTAPFSNHPR